MLKSHRLDFWNVEDLSEQTTVQAKMILKKKKNNWDPDSELFLLQFLLD